MKARVFVTLKSGVLDPQGKAIEGALSSMGIAGIGSVRQGKVFDLDLDASDEAAAGRLIRSACERLLANTVIENYRFDVTAGAPVVASAAPAADPMQEAAIDAEMPAEGHP